MTKAIIYGLGGLGVLGLYLYIRNSNASLTPAVTGAPQGTTSSSPSTLYSLFFPQAARADNNPALNNQPYAQKPPTGGGTLAGVGGWAGATSSVADAFKSIFGSTSSDAYSLDVSDAGHINMASNDDSFYSEDFNDLDSSYGNSSQEMTA